VKWVRPVSEAVQMQKEKKKGVHTKLDVDIMSELYRLKREMGVKTYSDVIRILIEKYKACEGEKK
jgi:antitoxin component of RelBE/YafQ-DinJ toxin-antitoxin module